MSFDLKDRVSKRVCIFNILCVCRIFNKVKMLSELILLVFVVTRDQNEHCVGRSPTNFGPVLTEKDSHY